VVAGADRKAGRLPAPRGAGAEVGLFEVWLLLGALLAAPVFASSVVAMPMLVDTTVPVSMAVGELARGGQPPGPMACGRC
jgi:hypothetical protein